MKVQVEKSFCGHYSGKKGQVIELPESEAKSLQQYGLVTIIDAPAEKDKVTAAPKAAQAKTAKGKSGK